MRLYDLETPAVLVDLDILERNIARYQKLADDHHKQLWPMIKTHKSTEMAAMQQAAGATGFLCGTLDECEALAAAGVHNIMHAYPVAGAANLARVVSLARRCDLVVRVDGADNARLLDEAATAAGVTVGCTIIVDSGLHRFGIAPAAAPELAARIKAMPGLRFRGVSSHPGHVYEARQGSEVPRYVQDEQTAVAAAVAALEAAGHACEIVSSGSTPTFPAAVADPRINVYHPGNYVFNDAIQMALDIATEQDCSLAVLATVIARPAPDRILVDAGAKCLGLDQGAHGIESVAGHGRVKGHPEIVVAGLSEEVGKLKVSPDCALRIGDKVAIIPNHACSACNLTDYLIGCRGGEVERTIRVDIRGNSTRKGA